MAKLSTEKKTEFFRAQSEFINFGVTCIENWTKEELKKYRSMPVVIPKGNYGFLVANFEIKGINKCNWEVMQSDSKLIHNFTSKTTAILYCLLIASKRFKTADEILGLDQKIANLEMDLEIYNYQMKKTKDFFKYSNLLNRTVQAKMLRQDLIKLLQKTLISAKYLNFGK